MDKQQYRYKIPVWWEIARKQRGLTHFIVINRNGTGEPLYVVPPMDLGAEIAKAGDTALEVYSLAIDRMEQMNAHRTWNDK